MLKIYRLAALQPCPVKPLQLLSIAEDGSFSTFLASILSPPSTQNVARGEVGEDQIQSKA